ncbi:HutD family protein [Entomomonas sp. E2T0]|uniref:HutD/Ves family protein n=1 Tax=Entomomonas sp. E2T0 TaxID=2930213 RepID=UPI0022281FC8|nr:HutD family protein [Entomomonas sp. E2T0]UYZ84403.1 HutD family protein [Entomomonas sp. E2T0]
MGTIKKLKDYQQMDWPCTSGISTEIARNEDSPSKEVFDWRLAMEDVQGGALSPFNGFIRIFSVLEGAAANVVINGQYENTLKTYDLVRLEAGSATNVNLPAGPVKDLSLLYNNELYTGAYQWCQVGTEPQTFNSMADTVLVFSAAPQVTVTTGGSAQALSRYDTLITSGGQDISVSGSSPADYACIVELLRH